MTIIVIILVIYLAGMLAIGFAGRGNTKTLKDFLTAGRKGTLLMLVGSYMGAHIGNGIVVGGATYGAQYGIGGAWFGIGACLSFILFALVMSRKVYREGYVTIPDMITARYHSGAASVLMAVLNITASLGIMAAQIMAGSALFGYIGLNPTLGAVVTAVIVFIYSAMSGMWGVMMTDVIQSAVIVVSSVIIVILIGAKGGFGVMSANLPASSFVPVPFDAETLVMMLLPAALNGLISGASFQRTASCKDERVAVLSPIIASVILIPFVVLPVLIGMYGSAVFPDAAQASIIFTVLAEAMPAVIGGLMVAAILSAVMSTVDIGLLNVTANAVNDIYHKTINPKADEKKLSRASIIVTLVAGVIALLISLQFTSILSLLSSTYSIMNAGALVMVLGGMFWKKGTTAGALASAVCGIATVLLNMSGLVAVPYVSLVSLIPALIAYVVVSLATQPKGDNRAAA